MPALHVQVNTGSVEVSCLLDTGSMVSTVTESFFYQHFAFWGPEKLQVCSWLELRPYWPLRARSQALWHGPVLLWGVGG